MKIGQQDEGGRIVTSADIHQAVFGAKRPKKRSLGELKAGIRKYVRKRYGRG